ncbi:MFS general substrate transporter [Aureobasidium subglaciale]|nr:MFS general substrate transporter [Aureobasidium subglaciale]
MPILHPEKVDTVAIPTEDTIYPEGGTQAWLVVLGAWCGLTASIGVYNTTGVFSVIISSTILPSTSASSLGWLFSIYAFVVWIVGVWVGPCFDVFGPRLLLLAGTCCTVVGIMCLSFCTEYYQIFLAFSLLTGLGSSLLLTPSMACVAHWFNNRRGVASGVAWTGAGLGGVIFPLMIQALLPNLDWGWTIRVLGFVLLVLCSISICFCRSRIPARAPKDGRSIWRSTLPDYRIFLDGTGAMVVTTMGVLFVDLAYFIPITYLPSYYLARQNLDQEAAITGSAAFAYQLLAILNAASCSGRLLAGSLGDHFGHYNTMILSLLFCVISVLALWLPDILSPELSSPALLVIFVIIFGFVSGSNVSLTPICLGQLCDIRDYGRYYASCYTVVAFGVLLSLPAAGGILEAVDAGGKGQFWGVALFTGGCYVIALICFIWVRIKVKGWTWAYKW